MVTWVWCIARFVGVLKLTAGDEMGRFQILPQLPGCVLMSMAFECSGFAESSWTRVQSFSCTLGV